MLYVTDLVARPDPKEPGAFFWSLCHPRLLIFSPFLWTRKCMCAQDAGLGSTLQNVVYVLYSLSNTLKFLTYEIDLAPRVRDENYRPVLEKHKIDIYMAQK